ncbi:hypothetical protein AJ79_08407 [Helicocarpus griseus UAMH5409]|uniref:Uncharacterized protein n=1 Tax=Helicocarpus griseus UAMH5409 TaxID=1447875 RepID=A0A2B7WSM3_9EURO|nr:hypothetical protein AJ79_08407 [Helicocarpus griseus UAMH5409]
MSQHDPSTDGKYNEIWEHFQKLAEEPHEERRKKLIAAGHTIITKSVPYDNGDDIDMKRPKSTLADPTTVIERTSTIRTETEYSNTEDFDRSLSTIKGLIRSNRAAIEEDLLKRFKGGAGKGAVEYQPRWKR